MLNSTPTTHGAHLVARASFGTVLFVGVSLFIGSLATQQPYSVYLALITGMAGAGFGYWLWLQGLHRTATALHTAGLVGAGLLCYAATETLGGTTAILMLASVITAGGLAGRSGALGSVAAVLVACVVGHTWPQELRALAGLSVQPYSVPEALVAVFVLTSVPSWAAYVVAVDASNRTAWLQADRSARELAEVNAQLAEAVRHLQLREESLQRAVEQQAAVARFGEYVTGTSSHELVRARAARLLSQLCGCDAILADGDPGVRAYRQADLAQVSPETRPFARAILRLLAAHAARARQVA